MNLGIDTNSLLRLSLVRITFTLLSILILICYTTLPIYAQNSAEEYIDRGNEKANAGDYRGAIEDYNKAIEMNPKDADAYSDRGLTKAHLGDYRGAIEDSNKAIEINPRYAKAYHSRGLFKLRLVKLGLGQKDSGCLDLSKAGELGYSKAYESIKKYCNP